MRKKHITRIIEVFIICAFIGSNFGQLTLSNIVNELTLFVRGNNLIFNIFCELAIAFIILLMIIKLSIQYRKLLVSSRFCNVRATKLKHEGKSSVSIRKNNIKTTLNNDGFTVLNL